jgi:hypothetical protein
MKLSDVFRSSCQLHSTLFSFSQQQDFLRGADQGRRELAVCVDQLPNLDADTCGNTQCTSKDLEIVGAYLETDGCLQCSCGEQVTANLKLRIKNKTGSYRVSFYEMVSTAWLPYNFSHLLVSFSLTFPDGFWLHCQPCRETRRMWRIGDD